MQICALDGTMALIIQCQQIISILEGVCVCVRVGDKSDDHKQLVFPDTMLMLSLRTPYPLFFIY